jgi:hypothetical protein
MYLMRRVIAGLVVLGGLAILSVAAWLTPSGSGVGTHEAMSLPKCGWVAIADFPCPTCGMTTAFAHAANGDFVASFLAQPVGFLLAIATAMATLVSLHIAVTGSRLERPFARLWGRHSGWILSALILAAWGFKIVSYKGWFEA